MKEERRNIRGVIYPMIFAITLLIVMFFASKKTEINWMMDETVHFLKVMNDIHDQYVAGNEKVAAEIANGNLSRTIFYLETYKSLSEKQRMKFLDRVSMSFIIGRDSELFFEKSNGGKGDFINPMTRWLEKNFSSVYTVDNPMYGIHQTYWQTVLSRY